MWEAIQSNIRRSRLMIGLMGLLLIILGTVIGLAVDPTLGGAVGALTALGVWLILWLAAFFSGDQILLSCAGAHPITKEDSPRLFNIVEEMAIASGLPKAPAIYIIEDDAPNAFAVGRKPECAAIAVTSGLMRRLTRDELQGVVAHEIGHIRNLDIRFMTQAAVLVGSITLLADGFLRSLRYGLGRRSSRDSDNGSAQVQLILFVAALVIAILAPILAQVLYFSCSRRREFLADASSARYTRYPEGLASALEKIAGRSSLMMSPNRAIAPMYIVNPLQAASLSAGLFSTHPPTKQRVEVLRAMAGKAGFADYEAAFGRALGEKNHCLDRRTVDSEGSLAARAPSQDPQTAEPEGRLDARWFNPDNDPAQDAVARSREVTNLLGRIGDLLALPCACGLTIKVPPGFPGQTVTCPRCGAVHEVPRAETVAPAEKTTPGLPPPTLRYERKQAGWESFRCACGRSIQLSPTFDGQFVHCPKCKRRIEIAKAAARVEV